MTMQQRVANMRDDIKHDRIIRGKWVDGKGRVCLLASLSHEVAQAKKASACPADVCPQWWADLAPALDDHGSEGAWPGMVRRYADLAARWGCLDEPAWARLEHRCRLIAIREARSHAPKAGAALDSIDAVIALHERAIAGDPPAPSEWFAARSAALDASLSAVRSAAKAAVRSAVWASARAAAWSAARSGAWAAAQIAAWDRMTVAFFDAMEHEIALAVGGA